MKVRVGVACKMGAGRRILLAFLTPILPYLLVLTPPDVGCSTQQAPSEVSHSSCSSSNGANLTCISSWNFPQDEQQSGYFYVRNVTWLYFYMEMGVLNYSSHCVVNRDDINVTRVTCHIQVIRTPASCSRDLNISISGSGRQNTHSIYLEYDRDIAPSPPSQVLVTPVSESQLQVTWSPAPDRDMNCEIPYYCVEIHYHPLDGQIHEWQKVEFEKYCYHVWGQRITQLSPFTLYNVRVRLAIPTAPTYEVWGPWSKPVQSRTLEVAPKGQLNVTLKSIRIPARPYYRNIQLSWHELDPSDAQGIIIGYKVHLISPNRDWNVIGTSFAIPDLERFQLYEGWITPYNGKGDGDHTAFKIADQTKSPPKRPVLRFLSSSSKITVSVSKPVDPNGHILYYRVKWQKRGNTECHVVQMPFNKSAETNDYVIGSLVPDSVYDISVYAINRDNRSGIADAVVKTAERKPAHQPQRFKVSTSAAKPDTILLHWDALKSNISGTSSWYTIFYCQVDIETCDVIVRLNETNCTGAPGGRNVTQNDPSPFQLVGLNPYTCYKLWLRAVNSAGSGPKSGYAIQMTAPGRPSSPVDLKVLRVTPSLIEVTWSAPLRPNGPITHYVVKFNGRSVVSNMTRAVLNVHGYSEYNVMVQACQNNLVAPHIACSNMTSSLRIMTPIGAPSPPRKVRLTQSAHDKVRVQWDPPMYANGPPPMIFYVVTYAPTSVASPSERDVAAPERPYYQTTDTRASFEVECTSKITDYRFDVVAVIMNETEELKSDVTSANVGMCGLSAEDSGLQIGIVISLSTLVVSCCLAFFIYWRYFRQSGTFDKIYFADIVVRSKASQRARMHEQEEFDDIQSQPPPEEINSLLNDSGIIIEEVESRRVSADPPPPYVAASNSTFAQTAPPRPSLQLQNASSETITADFRLPRNEVGHASDMESLCNVVYAQIVGTTKTNYVSANGESSNKFSVTPWKASPGKCAATIRCSSSCIQLNERNKCNAPNLPKGDNKFIRCIDEQGGTVGKAHDNKTTAVDFKSCSVSAPRENDNGYVCISTRHA